MWEVVGAKLRTNLKDFQTDLDTIPITTDALLSTFPGLGNIRSAQRGDGDQKVIIDDLAKGGALHLPIQD